MQFLKHKIPPPLVAVICAFLSWFLASTVEPLNIDASGRIALCLAFLLLGGFFGVAGVVSFKKAQTTINPLRPSRASSLVASGIFKYTRNPMYLCLALVLTAFSIYLASPVALIGVGAFIVYMNEFQIKPEEQALTELFGDEFIEYKSKVRRWI